ncbi:MAG: AMP-dependent synthetase [Oligoflexia bacterium]|nr:MAG: AMP-dependent synthetase [Oligoflexia bacterium]
MKRTICHSVLEMPSRPQNACAVRTKIDDNWQCYSWKEYFERIELTGLGLLELGIKQGENVVIFSNTRFEWSVLDYAIMGIKAITIPIYQTVTPEELEYILNNCEARTLIVENKSTWKTWQTVKDRCPLIENIISIDQINSDCLPLNEIKEKGQKRKLNNSDEFSQLLSSCKPEDVATILYTSGTTGLPKGVVLTHEQIMSEVSEAFPYAGVNPSDVGLSFLPYAHILGRIEHWGHTFIGYTLAYAESIDKIRNNLVEIQPTILVAVPRIFEKIYTALWTQVEANPVKARIFKQALRIAEKVSHHRLKHEPIPLTLMLEYKAAETLVLNKIKEAFGGRLRFAISGGAPIGKEIAMFFHSCGILILEGYGLTETTAAICVNVPFDYRFGSVGKPIGDVQLKIAEDGEILVKSRKVMREYYKNPQATEDAFVDGWFKTGDIGEILPSGDLKITDRKKDLIKTSGGKYIAPQRLESLLKLNSFISQVLIHGDQKKYVVALITLDKNFLIEYAKQKEISYQDIATLSQHPSVLEMVRKGVAETNSHLASFETVKRFAVLPTDFTVEAGELTPSLKVKRKVLDKKYHKQIEALYAS